MKQNTVKSSGFPREGDTGNSSARQWRLPTAAPRLCSGGLRPVPAAAALPAFLRARRVPPPQPAAPQRGGHPGLAGAFTRGVHHLAARQPLAQSIAMPTVPSGARGSPSRGDTHTFPAPCTTLPGWKMGSALSDNRKTPISPNAPKSFPSPHRGKTPLFGRAAPAPVPGSTSVGKPLLWAGSSH